MVRWISLGSWLWLLQVGTMGEGLRQSVCKGVGHIESFSLKDQDRVRRTFRFPHAAVRVFLVSRRDGSGLVSDWVETIRDGFPKGVELQGVASLGSVPRFSRALVRPFIGRMTREPVLLDWEGFFPVPEKGVLILRVTSRCGAVSDLEVGAPSEEEVRRVRRRIRETLAAPLCEKEGGNRQNQDDLEGSREE